MTASSPTAFFPLLSWFRALCSPTPVLSWSAPPVGETKNVEKVIPRAAINTVIWRIAIFYVGSVVLLCLLMPYTAYKGTESPFVTFFDAIGIQGTAPDYAAGRYYRGCFLAERWPVLHPGRILHSMGVAGSAPKFTTKVSRSGVPVARYSG